MNDALNIKYDNKHAERYKDELLNISDNFIKTVKFQLKSVIERVKDNSNIVCITTSDLST